MTPVGEVAREVGYDDPKYFIGYRSALDRDNDGIACDK